MMRNSKLSALKLLGAFLLFTFILCLFTDPALAEDVDDIAEHIVNQSSKLPGLITAFAYMMGLIFAVSGIFKMKEHVENPNQTAIRVPIIRFLVGGGLFALPTVYRAMTTAIHSGGQTNFDLNGDLMTSVSSVLMGISTFDGMLPSGNINEILQHLMDSITNLPTFISALAYILGLIMGVGGLFKVKEHVEDPDRVPLREGVVRFLVGGALFAIPTIFDAMYNTINAAGTLTGLPGMLSYLSDKLAGIGDALGMFWSTDAGKVSCGTDLTSFLPDILKTFIDDGNTSVGGILCNIVMSTSAIPMFLTGISYLLGMVFGLWALLKIRDHVLNPSQTRLNEGVTRLLAGGAFFALPFIISVVESTMSTDSLFHSVTILANDGMTNTGFAGTGCGGESSGILSAISSAASSIVSSVSSAISSSSSSSSAVSGGLDVHLACLAADILGPAQVLINFFGYAAGTILIMIGISRMIRSAQEGPKGPGGIGTIMTFVIAGALISLNNIIRVFSGSLYQNMTSLTKAKLTYLGGMSTGEQVAALNSISAILKFMIIIGLISFIRGLFIIRSVSEGNGQASIMAGVTHIIAGAVAINLGPLINAVQISLGITSMVSFS